MFHEPVLIYSLDIFDGEGGSVVLIVLMVSAVVLVVIDDGQNLDKVLACMQDIPEQLIVELQYPFPLTPRTWG